MKRIHLAIGIFILAVVATQAGAQQTFTLQGAGSLAVGAGAKVEKMADGGRRADNGRAVKLCPESALAVASAMPVTLKTAQGETTYRDGLVACLDPAQFPGGAAADFSTGTLHLMPAAPPSTPQPSSAPSL